ncbi:MAG: S-layer homology domain-containing protein [Candidatus Margulisbacteria bacterium]|nr:S-layer homology domain-containing protein [Candidatus Margulisiibacteriota bacterium]
MIRCKHLRRALICLSCVFLVFYEANAFPQIEIKSPKDRAVVFDNFVPIKGKVIGAKSLIINGKSIKPGSSGVFSGDAVIKNGKNLILVEAVDAGGAKKNQKIRIIKKVFYPDNDKVWAKEAVQNLAAQNLIEGYPDDNFYPDYPITRGEFATWLARVNDIKLPELTSDPFADVPKEHWRAPYISAVVKKGHMTAISEGVFGIDEPLMRSEVAEIALKAEGVSIINELSGTLFKDVPAGKSFQKAVNTAKKEGLLIGISKKAPVFDPNRYLTRAEAAMLLSRFRKAQEKVAYLLNFDKGFDDKVLAKVDVAPMIAKLAISPPSVLINTAQVIKLRASIASRQGFYPISKVVVDLSSLGGDADVEMYDDGSYGDEKAKDNTYSLNINLTTPADGEKVITVTAIDTLGLEGKKTASLWVVK